LAFSVALGAVLSGQTRHVTDPTARARAVPPSAALHLGSMLHPQTAKIELALATPASADRATVEANVRALTDLSDAELIVVLGAGADLTAGPAVEPLSLAPGEALSRTYEVVFDPDVRSSVTLRVRTPHVSTEKSINLPFSPPEPIDRRSRATFDGREVAVVHVAEPQPNTVR
jgi:hypothetical protein